MLHPSTQLIEALLRWYDRVQGDRAMPWRNVRDPYAIWISEIMLQQTQVQTVKPYYARFLKRFPTVRALAAADLQEVLALWAGLGYYRRAKHLHAAAKDVVARFGGTLPAEAAALRTLPGIGRYTAGAIASIAFGKAEPVVDGNVMRVLARLAVYDKDIAQPRHTEFFWEMASHLHAHVCNSTAKSRGIESAGRAPMPVPARHGDFNQALMELGATVCTPVTPACGDCPLSATCRAHAEGRQEQLPVKAAKRAVPVQHLAAVVILRKSRLGRHVLVMQRPKGGLWEAMWEFPAIQLPRDRADPQSIGQAVGIRAAEPRHAGRVKHQLTHRTLWYRVFVVETAERSPSIKSLMQRLGGWASYVKAKWLPWPLAEVQATPLAAVVRRIAEQAAAAE